MVNSITQLVVILVFIRYASLLRCTDENDIGTTFPQAEINVRRNESFEIFCMLDRSRKDISPYNASNLYFTNESSKEGAIVIERSKYRVVNDSVLALRETLNWPVSYMYWCRLNGSSHSEQGVCANVINVGSTPLELQNFSCQVLNWQSVVCNWTIPYNAVRTIYHVTYATSNYFSWKCSNPDVHHFSSYYPGATNCQVPENIFQPSRDPFYIKVSASNALGNRTFPLRQFATYSIIVPEPPIVEISSVTVRSLVVTLSIKFPLVAFPHPVFIELLIRAEYDAVFQHLNKSSLVFPPPDPLPRHSARQVVVPVAHLLPHTRYHLRVRIRCSNNSRMHVWSSYETAETVTASAPPSQPPLVDAISFQVLGESGAGNRNIRLFWRPVDRRHHNAAGFNYCLETYVAGMAVPLAAARITNTSALLVNMSAGRLLLGVASCNQLGKSAPAHVLVPPASRRPPLPYAIAVVQLASRQYRVMWRHDGPRVATSFTLFWGDKPVAPDSQCDRLRGWQHVARGAARGRVSANISTSDDAVPVVAVAAVAHASLSASRAENTGQLGGSGLRWAECYVTRGHPAPGQLQSVKVESVRADGVSLSFTADCITTALSIHYEVHVCRVLSRTDSLANAANTSSVLSAQQRCSTDPRSRRAVLVANSGASVVSVRRLLPATAYLVRVASVYDGGRSRPSAWLSVNTAMADSEGERGGSVGAVLAGLVGTGVCVVLLVLACRRVRRQWAKLRAIKVNLPSGLHNFERSPLFNGSSDRGVDVVTPGERCDHHSVQLSRATTTAYHQHCGHDAPLQDGHDAVMEVAATPITSYFSSLHSAHHALQPNTVTESPAPVIHPPPSPPSPPPLYVQVASLNVDLTSPARASAAAQDDSLDQQLPAASGDLVLADLDRAVSEVGQHVTSVSSSAEQLDDGAICVSALDGASGGSVSVAAPHSLHSSSSTLSRSPAPSSSSAVAVPTVHFSPYVDAAMVRALMSQAPRQQSADLPAGRLPHTDN